MTATPYQRHALRWRDCTACPLHEGRSRVVLARGRVPCDVLFVGEAPGESEDVLGVPFCGPAGKLLDSIIDRAGLNGAASSPGVTYALTNLVACIPRVEDGGKAGEPPDESVRACRPRLEEFVGIANPRLIVAVGKLAADWLDRGYRHSVRVPEGVEVVPIDHPAFVLRANEAQRGYLIRRAIVTLQTAVRELA